MSQKKNFKVFTKRLIKAFQLLLWQASGKSNNKIFVISFQRTGTTSTGQFFKDHGFPVATWAYTRKNDWTISWFKGDYERVFRSMDFKTSTVFEDDPWWCQDFYKVLFHRFPKAKFVMLERDSDKWFNSMISHSSGKTLGNTHRHANIYRRELEIIGNPDVLKNAYSRELDNMLDLSEDLREHYKTVYKARNNEVKLFFKNFGPERLFTGQLEDKEVWHKMGKFFGITVNSNYSVHANKSMK